MFKQTTLSDYWRSEDSDAEEDSEVQIHADDVDEQIDSQAQFKHLYWSRMVSLQQDMADQHERWPVAPDIKESIDALAILDS